MTTRGRDFEKMYDLTENILPGDIDVTPPTDQEYVQHLVRTSLKALGIGYVKDIAYRGRYTGKKIHAELQNLVDAGEVSLVEVEGLKGSPLYMLKEYTSKKIKLTGDAFILSPFDVLNVLRHRLKDFFDFNYQVECFVPAPKRKYGYFSLPVLVGDRFVARMDSKADRKKGVLIVNNFHVEPVKMTNPAIGKVCDAIREFAAFNGCESVSITKCNDKALLKVLRQTLD
jgi:uncharacterized protein YcaQ